MKLTELTREAVFERDSAAAKYHKAFYAREILSPPTMTMNDWRAYYKDRRTSIYGIWNRDFELNSYLLVSGSMYDWNEAGFLQGPYHDFSNWTKREERLFRAALEERIVMDKKFERHAKEAEKNGYNDLAFRIRRTRQEHRPREELTYGWLDDHSNFILMPSNAHRSYVHAGIQIAYEILNQPKETKRSKQYAIKFLKKWEK